MKRRLVVDISSCLFVVLFLYTGISKLMDLKTFRWALIKSPLLRGSAKYLVLLIPTVEIIIAFSLLIPFFVDRPFLRRWGLLSAALLMFLFAIYVGYMLEFRKDRPCTCGGIISKMNWHQHFYFNVIFSGIAFVAVRANQKLNIS